ncbi:MAG: PhoH family protein [Rhodothermales bacterium]
MTEKRITIEGVEPLLLFGFNDVYLKRVERAFPDTTIVARGNTVLLRGSSTFELKRIAQVLNELTVLLNRNGNLTENDVETLLDVLTASSTGSTSTSTPVLGTRDVLLFTPNGGMVKAKTPNQAALVEAARSNDLVFAAGPAGTGKTYTAVAIAVAALKSKQVKRIVLSRPAVEAGERLGFLPGDLRDKVDPYLRPLYDALEDMIEREKLGSFMNQNIVEIVPLAYMRGRTLNSAFVILDEAQNATTQQMKMFLTRLGANSRAIITGDQTQIDLPHRSQSGLLEAIRILQNIDGIEIVNFDRSDIIRHRLVKEIIQAYEEHSDASE